jgi:hypothetical protein
MAGEIPDPGSIPCFPNTSKILFHPRFVADGWDTVQFGDTEVHLLHPIPLTDRESQLARDSISALLKYWDDEGIDIFLDRPSTP